MNKNQIIKKASMNSMIYTHQTSKISSFFNKASHISSVARFSSSSDDQATNNQLKPAAKRTKTTQSRTLARLINNREWNDELTSCISSLSPSLSKTTVTQSLRLIRTPVKAFKFFKYVQATGFAHSEQSYFAMLEILGQNSNLNAARNFMFSIEKSSGGSVKLNHKFFNSLITSYGRAGLFNESMKLFLRMKTIGVNPSVVTFNTLFSILLKRGRTNLAKQVFDEMLRTYGVKPDTYSFNILIKGFALNSMVDESFHFFKDMSRLGCEPDLITYNTLVDGLCRDGKVSIAHNLLKGMIKKKDLGLILPDVVTYTTLIRGYCMKQDIDEALRVFEDMISQGLKPNNVTYNTVIQGLCEARKLDKIKEILDGTLLKGGEFIPDACTFNILMNAHCNGGNLNEALRVFDKMMSMSIQPDSACYSVLIRSFCQKGDFRKAEELFDELSEKGVLLSDKGCTPLVAAYKPMFEYLCRNGKTNKAEKVFKQLLKRGVQDPASYKILITGHCRERNFEAGYDLLILMLRRDYSPDLEIYESLIDGLLLNNHPLLAYKIVEKMLNTASLYLKTHTAHSVLSSLLKNRCAQESASLLTLMLERQIRQNISLSTETTKLLFQKGMHDNAFEVVGLLYSNGFMIEMEELINFLCHIGKHLEAHKMLLFCLENKQRLNGDMFNRVMLELVKRKKITEAFGLYYELVESGRRQTLTCLDELRIRLEARGKSAEADFVQKTMQKQEET